MQLAAPAGLLAVLGDAVTICAQLWMRWPTVWLSSTTAVSYTHLTLPTTPYV